MIQFPNYQMRNKRFQKILILFIIYKKRELKKNKIKNNKIISQNSFSFINEEFEQIFIDNLKGKDKNDIFKIVSKQIPKNFIRESNFINNKKYSILNYINYNILFETKELNHNNYISAIAKKIIQNKTVYELLEKNIEKQGDSLKDIIKEVFTSDILEVNDIDFLEVIDSRLNYSYSLNLLNIILAGFKENILNQLLINKNLNILF